MDKKDCIKKAAAKLMAEKGYYNTKIQEIANEAGVANGTIYLYFKNKEDIINYIFKVELVKRLKFIEQLNEKGGSYLSKIQDFVLFCVKELKSNPDITKVTVNEASDPKIKNIEWVKITSYEIIFILKQMLDEAKIHGEIRDYNTKLIATLLYFSVRGIVYMLIVEEYEENIDMNIDQFLNFFIDGIKNKNNG
jgi:TetR/AcrR family fatty acid metabolism transcriptional regulator